MIDGSITNEVYIELHGVSDTLEVDITQLEVLAAIRTVKNNKAPGPDGLISMQLFVLFSFSHSALISFWIQYIRKGTSILPTTTGLFLSFMLVENCTAIF